MHPTTVALANFLDEFIIYIDTFPPTPEEEIVQLTLLGELYQLLQTVEQLEKGVILNDDNIDEYLTEVVDYIKQIKAGL